MPPNGRAQPRALAYSSSSEDSYGRVGSMHSDSGTSQTHYDDTGPTPSPKVLLDEYAREPLDLDGLQQPVDFRRRNTDMSDPSMHLLVETAAADSRLYDILSLEELNHLKKEEQSIRRQADNVRKRLHLESRVKDSAQSLNRLGSTTSRGGADPYIESVQKCDELARELWGLQKHLRILEEKRLKHSSGVLQLSHQHQQLQNSRGANGWRGSDDFHDFDFGGFGGSRGLADTADGIMDLPGQNSAETDAILQMMWQRLQVNEEHIQQKRQQQRRGPNDDDSEDEINPSEGYSLDSFAARIERLCNQSIRFQGQLQDQRAGVADELQDAHDRSLVSQKAYKDSQAQIMDIKLQLDQSRQEINFTKQQHQEAQRQVQNKETERADFEGEMVRLQTELTMAKADLDAAHGTRAERQAEGAKSNDLQKELGSLVAEHEALVQQSVEGERERDNIERTMDALREKTEDLEAKLSEERIKNMGRRTSEMSDTAGGMKSSEGSRSNAATSMSVMRNEFKKMMREARAEHFRVMRVCHFPIGPLLHV